MKTAISKFIVPFLLLIMGTVISVHAQWTTATLSQAREDLAATSVGNLVIFAGGATGTGSSAVVDIYDDSTHLWTTAMLSQARGGLTATSVGTKAFFAGGSANGV